MECNRSDVGKILWNNPLFLFGNNPSTLFDPDGKDVDVSQLTDEEHKKAFLSTKNGKSFISSYLKKGQSISIKIGDKNHVFMSKKDGAHVNDKLFIGSTSENLGLIDNKEVVGRTVITKSDNIQVGLDGYGGNDNKSDVRNDMNEQIWLKTGQNPDESIQTLGHEAFVHAFPDQNRLGDLRQALNDGNIKPRTKGYQMRLNLMRNAGSVDHKSFDGKFKCLQKFHVAIR